MSTAVTPHPDAFDTSDPADASDADRRRAMRWAGVATAAVGLLATAALFVEWAAAQVVGRAVHGLARGLAGGWATTGPDDLPSASDSAVDLLTTTTAATVLAVAAAVGLASRLGRSVTMPAWANGLVAAAWCGGLEVVVLVQLTGGFPH